MSSLDPAADPALADLNEPQRAAVLHDEGPLLVLAGPGSGKTRVITRRAAYLVHRGVPPRNILAITFTNKAADEMRRRIEALGVGRGMWVYTFHALGARLLRELGPLAHREPGFTIYDVEDRLRVIKEAVKSCNVDDSLLRPERIQGAISRAKNLLEMPEEYALRAEFGDGRIIARVYEQYEAFMEERNAVDFDDLLMLPALVLRARADLVEQLNIRFRYLLIDEYQDTNRAQYLIAQLLALHHRNICATGDPDQSIYAWRGADLNNILDFENDYPDAKVVRLEQNYRSFGRILEAASVLIAHNQQRKPKALWTTNPAGPPVEAWRFGTGEDEAARIADDIRTGHLEGRPYSDFAIFYRINALSRGLEDALRRRMIPYRIARGVAFYGRKEVRDVLAYLRVLVNPADAVALRRVINTPPRGIGKTTIERLERHAAATGQTLLDTLRDADRAPGLKTAAKRVRSFVNLLDELQSVAEDPVPQAVSRTLELSGLETALTKERNADGEDRLANVQELVTAAQRYVDETYEPSLSDFLHRIALVSDQDQVDQEAGVVMLMTLHAAKGLEFPVVFMAGLEHGLLPHENALKEDDRNVEEERRLCFVGMTRAQERLVLSHARMRTIRGQPLPQTKSIFLHELGEAPLEELDYSRATWGGPLRRMLGATRQEDEPTADADGFVPLDDQLSPEEAGQRRNLRRADWETAGPEDMPVIDVGASRQMLRTSPFADWQPGNRVDHPTYGVGKIIWIHPTPGQTRASIRFETGKEHTFILDKSPIRLRGE